MSAAAIAMSGTTLGTAGIGGEGGILETAGPRLFLGVSGGCRQILPMGHLSSSDPRLQVFSEMIFLTLDLEMNLDMELRDEQGALWASLGCGTHSPSQRVHL